VILSLILAFTQPVKPNIDYKPQYSYYYSIAKNKDLKTEIQKVKSNKPLKIANTVTVEQPEGFLIDTDIKLSKDEIIALIRDYSIKYNVDPERSIRIAKCESGFNPLAVNATGHTGLFQFNLRTFKANAKRLSLENPDVFNPEHNIQIATWMFSQNQYWQWGCDR
jgi:soluble lytic murein transglycosylase-like protein